MVVNEADVPCTTPSPMLYILVQEVDGPRPPINFATSFRVYTSVVLGVSIYSHCHSEPCSREAPRSREAHRPPQAF